jgi:hypothetical protein
METEFFQDGGQIIREKDICHHGPIFHYPLPLIILPEGLNKYRVENIAMKKQRTD